MKKQLLVITLMGLISTSAFAVKEGGGGDQYTLDFVRLATQVLYPWLVKNGSTLMPPVDSANFLISINPKQIASSEHIFESCDGSSRGREVDACYNANTDFIYISRTRYPLENDSPEKFLIIAHELFRKMGIEGDSYEITRQISILKNTDICAQSIYSLREIFIKTCTTIPSSELDSKCGNTFRELLAEWKEGVGKNCRGQPASDACMDACSPRMGLQCLSFCNRVTTE